MPVRLIESASRRYSLRAVTHPMDALPNEILADIFSFVVFDPDGPPTSICLLSEVCSRWRDVVITSANLWKRIVVALPVTDSHIEFTKLAIARSGMLPLTLLLDCRDPEWDWEDEDTHTFQCSDMQNIINLILPHAARWKDVDVLSDTWAPIHTFLQATGHVGTLTKLARISLARCNAYLAAPGQTFQPVSLATPVSLFGGRPVDCLQSVSLVGVHVDWESSPLQNLRFLEFKYHSSDVMPSLQQFKTIIQRCPELEELSIIGWGPLLGTSTTSPVSAISIPSLKKLAFGIIDLAYSTTLLSLMDLPSLQALSLEDVSRLVASMNDEDSSEFLAWMATSQASGRASFSGVIPVTKPLPLQAVQDLRLQSIQADEERMSDFLKCFPNLVKLSCHDTLDTVLNALAPKVSNPDRLSGSNVHCLCPRLTDLHFEDPDPALLSELVVGRPLSGSAAALTKVTVEFLRSPQPSQNSDVALQLENSGITVLGCPIGSEASDSD